jgi:hypothetical protein
MSSYHNSAVWTPGLVKTRVIWDRTWYLLVNSCWCFEEACCLLLQAVSSFQIRVPQLMEATVPPLTIGNYLQVSMAPYPRRLESLSSLLWKTSNLTCGSIFRSSSCQISWKYSRHFVDWFMKLVRGLDVLINVAILTDAFWQPVFVNTLQSEGLSIHSFVIYDYLWDCHRLSYRFIREIVTAYQIVILGILGKGWENNSLGVWIVPYFPGDIFY